MADAPVLTMVMDCREPEVLAAFWAAALGYENIGAVDNYVLLLPVDRSGPKLLLQQVPEEKAGKNRVHLDIEVPDIESLARRLAGLGARRMSGGVESEHGSRWIVMADPEGNEFCVCEGAGPG